MHERERGDERWRERVSLEGVGGNEIEETERRKSKTKVKHRFEGESERGKERESVCVRESSDIGQRKVREK